MTSYESPRDPNGSRGLSFFFILPVRHYLSAELRFLSTNAAAQTESRRAAAQIGAAELSPVGGVVSGSVSGCVAGSVSASVVGSVSTGAHSAFSGIDEILLHDFFMLQVSVSMICISYPKCWHIIMNIALKHGALNAFPLFFHLHAFFLPVSRFFCTFPAFSQIFRALPLFFSPDMWYIGAVKTSRPPAGPEPK